MNGRSIAARLPFYYGWVVIGIAFVTMSIGVSARTSFSLFFPPILDEFGWERGVTAAAFSIGFAASIMLVPTLGFLMTRFGPRLIIPAGATITAAGLVCATLATTPLGFYLTLGIMTVSFAVSMSYAGHSMFLPNWFLRRRGLATGIAFSGVGFGAIVILPWIQRVIETEGWRHACLSLAILLVAVIVPLNVIAQRREPASVGLEPDGSNRNGEKPSSRAPDTVVDRRWVDTDWTLARALRTARFWWVTFGFFTGLFAWYAVQVHQTKYLLDVGFAPDFAALALGLVGFCGIFGQIGVGGLSDRVGREWGWTIALTGFALCYVLLLVLPTVPSPAVVYAIVACQGLFGYGLGALYGTIVADIYSGPRFAVVFGFVSIGGNLGAGAGPWVTGAIFDRAGSYAPAFTLCAALALVSIFCIWMAAPRGVRLAAGVAVSRARRAS